MMSVSLVLRSIASRAFFIRLVSTGAVEAIKTPSDDSAKPSSEKKGIKKLVIPGLTVTHTKQASVYQQQVISPPVISPNFYHNFMALIYVSVFHLVF